ncbi:branched-chain amino acid transporter [Pseudomonas daroniae]|uniref:Branched-chain amino acid transporter n=1 Tax=Phytopseudomonas daroniae TaxID=2487519 RepID=A0A4Q9QRX6_9GAMM|nr:MULTISPECIES: AzlD domain-containing protein [Pseudomonas]TBU83290.1 branched-chain amino acid transporter [Pseudomonas daroniae]TBU84929.1 branched-chain amino acid transporter [Pseudomonas sp. FRB 228]TBU93778.1 branched-chain amino acid transporter [Pseudomonas daroniae]
MMIESAGSGAMIVVAVMAVVTLATRWGGIFVMSFVPINLRTQQFISAMSGSVLVALLAPLALEGDSGARLALLATAIVMLLVKKPLPAIAAGILVAALVRQLGA